MKLIGILAAIAWVTAVRAEAQIIIADTYDVPGNGTGFVLGDGVNSGINPPATRLSGSLAGDMRYLNTNAAKVSTAYSITNGKFQVAATPASGRLTLSNNGTSAFDFGPALGATTATASSPVTYDLRTSMANSESGIFRFSFGFGTVEGDVTVWDFGVQLYRAVATDNFYQIQRRINTFSSDVANINAPIAVPGPITYGTEVNFLLRVTDAGAEFTTFSSRVQLSLDGGSSFIYDTATDTSLPFGWRLDGGSRFLIWDIAGTGATSTGAVTYDNLSVTLIPEPAAGALALAGTLPACLLRRRRN